VALMTLTRADINRGYDDPRWGGHGYLKVRNETWRGEGSANRRSAADSALLRLANRRHWTYDDLFENVLNSAPGRVYGEWALDEYRSDAHLDTMLEAMEQHTGLTPGAHFAFEKPGSAKLEATTRLYGEEAERKFERNRRLEREVAEIAKRDADERRIDAMIRRGQARRRFSLTQRSGRARYRNR
jgi:hypothetical protein